MRTLRLQNPAGVFGDLSAFAPPPPPRVLPATTRPTLAWKTSWAGDEASPGQPAGHLHILVDGGPMKVVPIPASANDDALDATFAEYGVGDIIHVQTAEERAEEKRLAEEAAKPENVKARWLKQVEGLTDEELETVLDGWGVFRRSRQRSAKRVGVRSFFQAWLTPEEQRLAQDYIRRDLYTNDE